jgi:hypothetical protein
MYIQHRQLRTLLVSMTLLIGGLACGEPDDDTTTDPTEMMPHNHRTIGGEGEPAMSEMDNHAQTPSNNMSAPGNNMSDTGQNASNPDPGESNNTVESNNNPSPNNTTDPVDPIAPGEIPVFPADTDCTYTGFDSQRSVVYGNPTNASVNVVVSDGAGFPSNLLFLENYEGYDGVQGPGETMQLNLNYADCGTCLLVKTECADAVEACPGKTFSQRDGWVTYDHYGAFGDNVTGTVHWAILEEVTIDEWTESTPVPDGETWCIQSLDFDGLVLEPGQALQSL